MDVRTALTGRKSVRAFTDRPVATQTIREILELAARAPSGSNFQPWRVYVLVGQARDEVVRRVHAKSEELARGETPEYAIHPPQIVEPYSSRYFRASAMVYQAAGIEREDTTARRRHLLRNWSFFGAPVGLIFTLGREMGPGQWAGLGMYMQNVMLLARDYGLDTCAQEAWALWPTTLRRALSIPDNEMLFSGMAVGYADHSARINHFTSERAPIHEYVTIIETLAPED
jgi:nitroreductase